MHKGLSSKNPLHKIHTIGMDLSNITLPTKNL